MDILTFIDCYLPGYKAGGPIRSVSGMVAALPDTLRFRVVTRDRDHTDTRPYAEVRTNEWTDVGKAKVLYLPPAAIRVRNLARIANESAPDVIYLNSVFSGLSRRCLLARRLGLMPRVPFIVAPRGELSPGAMGLKSYKKRPFVHVARRVGLFSGIVWQASAERERAEISQLLGEDARVVVAPNLRGAVAPPSGEREGSLSSPKPEKRAGRARFVFISRISPKKNVLLALRAMGRLRGEVEFEIFGPVDDHAYWRECERLMRELPSNVAARYGGMLSPSEVHGVFSAKEFFVFPTLGENFGHAIIESLAARCPVVLSDRTPWAELESRKAGWILPVEDEDRWASVLQGCVDMGPEEYAQISGSAGDAAQALAAPTEALRLNLQMFREVQSGALAAAQ